MLLLCFRFGHVAFPRSLPNGLSSALRHSLLVIVLLWTQAYLVTALLDHLVFDAVIIRPKESRTFFLEVVTPGLPHGLRIEFGEGCDTGVDTLSTLVVAGL